MLIRFYLDNYKSFGTNKEFNLFPSPRFRRLNHHKYQMNGVDVLKLSAIYGANGSGKSNMILGLAHFQKLILDEITVSMITKDKFKFKSIRENDNIQFAIEFIANEKTFIYAIDLEDKKIKTEELYFSNLGKKEDELIFERIQDKQKTTINFYKELEEDQEGKILKKVIESNLVNPNKLLFKTLASLDEKFFKNVSSAFDWLTKNLVIISPYGKPAVLAHQIDTNKEFSTYAQNLLLSFDLGISKIKAEKEKIENFFDEDEVEEIRKEIENSESKILSLRANNKEELVVVKEGEDIYIKQVLLEHEISNGEKMEFDFNDESDGTIRLIDFIPAFRAITNYNTTYVVDEIERSIHPLIIKELIRKFSEDEHSKGQLIFSTHESHLLDQKILRQDEIWFSQKDKKGCTDLYSLSDYKEHNTIDIRKGYLNGRYGAIPFLGNLKDLNWNNENIAE